MLIKLLVVIAVVMTCLHAAVQLAPITPGEENFSLTKCDLCHFAVETIELVLQNNGTITQLENYMNKLCFMMPAMLQSECVMLVSRLPDLVQKLRDQETPDVACRQIGLCPAKDERPVLANRVASMK
jgi:hypothetical protein